MKSPQPNADGDFPESKPTPVGVFVTTHWSMVLAAGGTPTANSRKAVEVLCQAYWMPLFVFARRCGQSTDDAKDLTQSFFAHFLSRQSFTSADPDKGRFRSYLLGAFKHFMADVHDRNLALKRGGGHIPLSLSAEEGESCYRWEPADDRSPDKLFDRRWALTLMARSMHRLEEEFQLAGKGDLFAALKGFLSENAKGLAYQETAQKLGISEANLRMKISRLRRRYGELVRSEVAETVADAGDVKEEMRHLLDILRERS